MHLSYLKVVNWQTWILWKALTYIFKGLHVSILFEGSKLANMDTVESLDIHLQGSSSISYLKVVNWQTWILWKALTFIFKGLHVSISYLKVINLQTWILWKALTFIFKGLHVSISYLKVVNLQTWILWKSLDIHLQGSSCIYLLFEGSKLANMDTVEKP